MERFVRRLANFALDLLLNNPPDPDEFARRRLLDCDDGTTKVQVAGPYDCPCEPDEGVLFIHFTSDDYTHVTVAWKGVTVNMAGNFPTMGWDWDEGEFGLGGDWWKKGGQ